MKTTTDNSSSAKVFIATLANLPDWQALSEWPFTGWTNKILIAEC
jgi:hypothetical protein